LFLVLLLPQNLDFHIPLDVLLLTLLQHCDDDDDDDKNKNENKKKLLLQLLKTAATVVAVCKCWHICSQRTVNVLCYW